MRTRFASHRFGSLVVVLGTALYASGCGSSDDAAPGIDEDTGIDDTAPGDSGADTAAKPDSAVADGGSDGSGDGTTDGGADGTTTDGATDAASDGVTDATSDGTATDVATDAADAACDPLAAAATDVYVDKASTKASVGTLACPFHTILEATTLAAPASSARTIHVKGGTGTTSVDYTETASIEVKNGVILLGDGTAVTKILGGGTCAEGTAGCTVLVRGGGMVDGFTIGGTGVVTSATGKAVVKNSLITGSTTDGIRALGNVDLGPNIQSNKNAGNGLTASGTALVHVIAGTGAVNQFDENSGAGMSIGGTDSVLTFEGGSATSNKGDGISFANVPSALTTPIHTVTALVARTNGFDGTTANGHSGIVLGASSSLKLRTSVLLKNGGSGLIFNHGATNSIDIGNAATDLGGNTFATAGTADRNVKAGICAVSPPAAQPAEGNKWSVCPPTVNSSISDCGSASFSYVDIAYKKAGAVTTAFTTTVCATGP